ncbi:MAG: SUF system NifU family Fe-S cluster assembly protein [Candidatus Moranbacteria bacterium]|nr:SUF system NifU family Fe-S cluster assembly protein [Candidatus Moranbacteria bacterium]MBP6034055.1 SUF system NifU family Fe-S cluster assembly protein [Candidatus Moranbacteria bacterium]MBP7696114.1 SUF system NifU family Fe-S cluster assembly protein [Candidatus Moranbacteria bacterium]
MSLYQDLILDHYRNPRNQGVLKAPTHRAAANNPTCGDRLEMQLSVKNGIIADVKFSGSGCAISQASASLLSEFVKGKTIAEASTFDTDGLLALLGVSLSPNRLKCALLSLETFSKAVNSKQE